MMDRVVTTNNDDAINEINNELNEVLAKLILLMKKVGEQKPDDVLKAKVLFEVYERVIKATETLKVANDLINKSYYHHPIFLE